MFWPQTWLFILLVVLIEKEADVNKISFDSL